MHFFAAGSFNIGRITQVIFHIAAKTRFLVVGFAFKFGKYLLISFFHDIGQHVQTPAMRHADNKFLYAQFRAFLDDRIHSRDQRLSAFQRKTFLPQEFGA